MRHTFRAIRKLDWSQYPADAIQKLFNEFGEIPYMVTDYDEGKIIHRAIPVSDDENIKKVCQVSYKPENLNTTYLRASTPLRTMFYGAVIPEEKDTGGIDNPRVTCAMESCSFLRNTKLDGKQKLLYGKWRVKSKISLITVLFTRYRCAKNSWIKGLSESFYHTIERFSYEEQKKYKRINNFISDEFSKHVGEKEDFKYLISSLFAQRIVENGFDGVLYPSVRTMTHGTNVAIVPATVEKKMELISVLECDVHKKGKKVVINNLRFCNVPEGNITFDLQDISDPDLTFTKEQIEYKLNT